MTLYSDAMKRHMAAYKRDTLQIDEHGIDHNHGKEHPHILPESMREHNIIPSARDAFWEYFAAHAYELPLHQAFHNLLSSQAFAFNLFFPFFGMGGDGHELLAALGAPVEPIASWRFEHMPDQAERTSVDFYVEYASGRRLLVEVKLTEATFGISESNQAREEKRVGWYRPRLNGRVPDAWLEPDAFFSKYQLLRNLAHLRPEHGDRLILLLPRANETAWTEANAFQAELVGAARDAVSVVAVEDVLARLEEAGADNDGHVALLRAKYAFSPA